MYQVICIIRKSNVDTLILKKEIMPLRHIDIKCILRCNAIDKVHIHNTYYNSVLLIFNILVCTLGVHNHKMTMALNISTLGIGSGNDDFIQLTHLLSCLDNNCSKSSFFTIIFTIHFFYSAVGANDSRIKKIINFHHCPTQYLEY